MAMIELHNIHKQFGSLEVLKGVDLTVDAGNTVVIIGPSGSGKTTLLRCMNLLEFPTQGTLRLGDYTLEFQPGTRVKKDTLIAFRKQTGMVFQGYNLFPHMTALQNVMEGQVTVLKRSKEEARDKALRMLDKVGLKIERMPIRTSSLEVSSNAWALREPWRWIQKSCCLTSPHLHWIQSWSETSSRS